MDYTRAKIPQVLTDARSGCVRPELDDVDFRKRILDLDLRFRRRARQ
jgi:hypothetical protein